MKTPLGEVCLGNKILFDIVARPPCTSPTRWWVGWGLGGLLPVLGLLLSRAGVLAPCFIYSVLLFCKAECPYKSCMAETEQAENNYINHHTSASRLLLFLILYSYVLNNLNPEFIIVSLIDMFISFALLDLKVVEMGRICLGLWV